jgi:hypothetical protein
MKSNHEVDLTATYRHVVNEARGEVQSAAMKSGADLATQMQVKTIFDGMDSIFNIIDAAKNEAAGFGIRYPELNDEAIEKRYRPVISKAVADVQAARDKVGRDISSLERTLEAATRPKLPAGADVQMQLLNMKNDFKMLFDSVHEASLPDAMLEELAGRIREGDEVGTYLLGADRWPALYLHSRGRETDAYNYSTKAAALFRPLQSETVQGQAIVLSFINAPGDQCGLKGLLANIDQFLLTELPVLIGSTARSWSTDAMHRF